MKSLRLQKLYLWQEFVMFCYFAQYIQVGKHFLFSHSVFILFAALLVHLCCLVLLKNPIFNTIKKKEKKKCKPKTKKLFQITISNLIGNSKLIAEDAEKVTFLYHCPFFYCSSQSSRPTVSLAETHSLSPSPLETFASHFWCQKQSCVNRQRKSKRNPVTFFYCMFALHDSKTLSCVKDIVNYVSLVCIFASSVIVSVHNKLAMSHVRGDRGVSPVAAFDVKPVFRG